MNQLKLRKYKTFQTIKKAVSQVKLDNKKIRENQFLRIFKKV